MGTLLCAVFSSLLVLFLFRVRISAAIYVTCLQKVTAKTNSLVSVYLLFFLICQLSSFYSNPCCKRKQKEGITNTEILFFHCSYSRFALTNLICFYGTEKLCARKACTFCKQTKEDGQGHRTAASKHSLKCTFLSPGLMLQYGVTSSLAIYLILVIVFL